MQDYSRRRRAPFPSRPEGSNPNVTSAIGLGETAGLMRARRSSLFTRTIIWITGLICLALLLGSLVQAWSNNQLMQQVRAARQQAQQAQAHHDALGKLVDHYKDPFVIESEARQQLGYVRPGEHPVVIVSASEPGTQNTAHTAASAPTNGFWQAWWNIFFGS